MSKNNGLQGLGKGYKIIVPMEVQCLPNAEEYDAARRLVAYFDQDIEIVPTRRRKKTPDFKIGDEYWELKTPRSNRQQVIARMLRRALKQARCIIIDLRHSQMSPVLARELLERAYRIRKNRIKRLVVIDRNKKVMEVGKK